MAGLEAFQIAAHFIHIEVEIRFRTGEALVSKRTGNNRSIGTPCREQAADTPAKVMACYGCVDTGEGEEPPKRLLWRNQMPRGARPGGATTL